MAMCTWGTGETTLKKTFKTKPQHVSQGKEVLTSRRSRFAWNIKAPRLKQISTEHSLGSQKRTRCQNSEDITKSRL